MGHQGKQASSAAVEITALTAIYFIAGKLGLSLAVVHHSSSPVWPPTGLCLAALLLFGPRLWPGVWLGAFLVNATTDGLLATDFCIATGNTIEALLAWWLVHRFAHGRNAFERTADIFRYVGLAAVLSTSVSATIGVGSLVVTGAAQVAQFVPIWTTWWLGDMVSALVLTPLILIWSKPPQPAWQRPQFAVMLLAVTLTALVALIVFGGVLPAPCARYPIAFLCLPPLVGAAVRLGPRGAVATLFVLAVVAITGNLRGLGPFAVADRNDSLLLMQAFLGVIGVTHLVLGAVASERRAAETDLHDSAALLCELVTAQERLQTEIEERKRLEAEVANAIEREQRRLGQELHEGLGQQLTAIGYLMTGLQAKLGNGASPHACDVKRLEEMIRLSVSNTRDLARGFYPVELERHGLLMALEALTTRRNGTAGVAYALESDGDPAGTELNGPLAIQLFRIAQEAVQNALQHSQAQHITIRLTHSADTIQLRITDDGIGLPAPQDQTKGLGLRIMQYRAGMVGGQVEFHNAPPHGLVVTCSVPFAPVPVAML